MEKKIIDYMKEVSVETIRNIENHIEIIDYLLKTPEYLLMLDSKLLKKLLVKSNDGKYLFEKYITQVKMLNKIFDLIDDGKMILDILNQYKDNSSITCSINSKHLLLELPGGKKVVEQLLEQNYDFKKLPISDLEIMKILYKYDRPEILMMVPQEYWFNRIEDGNSKTYFDYLLENKTKSKIRNRLSAPSDLKSKVIYYISLARHDMLGYAPGITIAELLSFDSPNNSQEKKTTLLEELLNADSDLTLNKILTPGMKENVNVAVILNIKGYKQDKVFLPNIYLEKFEEKLKNLRKEYYDNNTKSYGIGPLPKEGEQLLSQLEQLFLSDLKSDKELIKALVAGYKHGLLVNYEETLIELKKIIAVKQNNFDKFYYMKTTRTSYFSLSDETIHCEYAKVDTVLHETGHALHHFLGNNTRPENYNTIKKKIQLSTDIRYRIYEIDSYLKNLSQEISKRMGGIYKDNIEPVLIRGKDDREILLSSAKEKK